MTISIITVKQIANHIETYVTYDPMWLKKIFV